jgi:transcriptional regulator GlxA family with amidase domain
MTKVAVVEVEGRMASSAAITHDVMATANRISSAKRISPFQVTTVRFGSRRSWGELRGADLVIIPGLGSASGEELERNLKGHACRRARDMVANAFASGAMLAASCASTFLLAEGGLLDGRRATTTWWFAPLFRQRYPKVELVTEQIVVADWPIATAGAAMAQMDLMLAVVDRFASRSLAKACANHLLLDQRHSQVPFMAISYLSSQDPGVSKAEKWVRDNLARDFTGRNSPRPSHWRPERLPGVSRRRAEFHRFSSFNRSGWRPRDSC